MVLVIGICMALAALYMGGQWYGTVGAAVVALGLGGMYLVSFALYEQ